MTFKTVLLSHSLGHLKKTKANKVLREILKLFKINCVM